MINKQALSIWSWVGNAVRGDLVSMTLLGGSMSEGEGFESEKHWLLRVCSPCPVPVVQDGSAQLPAPASMPVACCSASVPSRLLQPRMEPQARINSSLHELPCS